MTQHHQAKIPGDIKAKGLPMSRPMLMVREALLQMAVAAETIIIMEVAAALTYQRVEMVGVILVQDQQDVLVTTRDAEESP